MLYLRDLLNQVDTDIRNVSIKRAFGYATEPVCVDGCIKESIVILANLTQPIDKIDDVLDEQLAITKLLNEKWLTRCITSAHYLHSHNLKYPDARLHGVIRVLNLPHPPDGYLCSSFNPEPTVMGYANDSKDVNISLFFGAAFIYEGRTSSLLSLFLQQNKEWLEALKNLIELPNFLTQLFELSAIYTTNVLPSDIPDTITPQLLVPCDNSYLAVTPVAAHKLQQSVHIACTKKHLFRYEIMYSDRATNVGALFSSTGNKLKVIRSLPLELDTNWFNNANPHWLSTKSLRTLFELISNDNYLESFHRKKERIKQNKTQLTETIRLWLASKPDLLHVEQKNRIHNLVHAFHEDLAKTHYSHRLAYHPYLLSTVERAIKHEISNIVISRYDNKPNRIYILLPGLFASRARAEGCPYIIGLPSLTAINGFAHNYCRRLSKLAGAQLTHDGSAFCLHSYSLTRRVITKEKYFNNEGKLRYPASISTPMCDISFSMIIQISESEIKLDQELIRAALPGRFANGSLDLPIEYQCTLNVYPSLHDAIHQIPIKNGKFLADVQHSAISSHSLSIEHHLQYLSDVLKEDKNTLLINKGYLLLEKPKFREGAANGYPHSFAEYVLGPVKLVKLSELHSISQLIWRLQSNKQWFLIQTETKDD